MLISKHAQKMIILSRSDLTAQTIAAVLSDFDVQIIPLRSRKVQTLPYPKIDILIIVDYPESYDALLAGRYFRLRHPEGHVIYLAGRLSALRLYLVHRCGFSAIISLRDNPLPHLTNFITQVLNGEQYDSAAIPQQQSHKELDALNFTQLMVLAQTVDGRRPLHIAKQLSCSINSVYRYQAVLRGHFAIENTAALIARFREDVD